MACDWECCSQYSKLEFKNPNPQSKINFLQVISMVLCYSNFIFIINETVFRGWMLKKKRTDSRLLKLSPNFCQLKNSLSDRSLQNLAKLLKIQSIEF